MDKSYGSFLLVSSIATAFFYLAIGFASDLINDFEGLRTIQFNLLLPTRSYRLLITQKIVSFCFYSSMLTAPLLPIGKLFLGQRLDLSQCSLFKLIILFVLAGSFFGCFGLWLAAVVKNQRTFSNVWRRVYTPMQFLGCYWFSFAMANSTFPWLSYISLCNPVTYISEGVRAAVFGQEKYMNFWLCTLALVFFISFFGVYAIKKLKLRLDFF